MYKNEPQCNPAYINTDEKWLKNTFRGTITNALELDEIGKLPHFVYISDCGCGVDELVSSCTSASNLPKKRKRISQV